MDGQGEYARAVTKSLSIAHRYSRDLKVCPGDVKTTWTLMLSVILRMFYIGDR